MRVTDVTMKVDGTSGNEVLEFQLAATLQEVFETFKKKQKSYGPGNIGTFGIRGVVVRMYDKMERLKRLVWDNIDNPIDNESCRDTFIDMSDYAAIAVLLLEDKWPK